MQKRTTKYISVLLALVLTISCFGAAFNVFADDLVAINDTNFSDAGWRQIVSYYYDKDNDGFLSTSERNVTSMSIAGMMDNVLGEDGKVRDLKGIEFFSSLTILRCGGIGLTTLNLSGLNNLQIVTCQGNELLNLDVSDNANIVELNCSDNQLTSIDVKSNTGINRLLCEENNLSSLNTDSLSELSYLKCSNNQLLSLDLSLNTKLETLICSGNHITSLDLSANTSLISATSYSIGSQTISAPANMSSTNFFIEVALPSSDKITSTNAQSYSNGGFLTDDYSVVKNGLTYSYATSNSAAEDLEVSVSCEKEFYIVNFYTDENKGTLLSTSYINLGDDAAAPEITDAPQCKAFDKWSDDITVVQSDFDVYAIWKTAHSSEKVTQIDENGTVTITCEGCGQNRTINFTDYITRSNDNSRYNKILDANNDGLVTARDFALLKQQCK